MSRSVVCRTTCACSVPASFPVLPQAPVAGQPHAVPSLKVLPRIQYSENWRDVDAAEVVALMQSVRPARSMQRLPLHILCGLAQDGEAAAGAMAVARLQQALQCSMAMVAAFVLEDKLPSYAAKQQAIPKPDDGPTEQPSDWSWVVQRRRRQRRKVLAGIARATGDCGLTASIWDLAVLPELQGLGLGRRLLARLTNQVRSRHGITDIGLVTPPEQIGFFQHCAFGPDKEASQAMLLRPDLLPLPTWPGLRHSPTLHECLEHRLNGQTHQQD